MDRSGPQWTERVDNL